MASGIRQIGQIPYPRVVALLRALAGAKEDVDAVGNWRFRLVGTDTPVRLDEIPLPASVPTSVPYTQPSHPYITAEQDGPFRPSRSLGQKLTLKHLRNGLNRDGFNIRGRVCEILSECDTVREPRTRLCHPIHQRTAATLPRTPTRAARYQQAEGCAERSTRGLTMSNSLGPSRDRHMGPLLRIVEESLTVTHLAALDLQKADPEWTALRALDWMSETGFDAAPLNEPEPCRVIITDELEANERPVREQARLIDSTMLVSADLSLADGIARLASRPFYLILHRDRLNGIVTRADLQQPAVSMVLFSLFFHLSPR